MQKICLLSLFLYLLIHVSASAQLTSLHEFSGLPDGDTPEGSLFYDGTFLYGTTVFGGVNDNGIIYKIQPDGSGFAKIHDFAALPDGSSPRSGLISDGTFLYGITNYGGTHNNGTIFKIKPDGTAYLKIFDFADTATGSLPWGNLLYDGTYLYGLDTFGGRYDKGTIFKVKTDGSSFMKLFDFAGISNGEQPFGSLIMDGTYLYGITTGGGVANSGVVFKIKPDSTGYTLLHEFTGSPDGGIGGDALYSDGTFMYGVTAYGGINNAGSLFKIKPDGSSYQKIFDMDTIPTGYDPHVALLPVGSYLYGATLMGGLNAAGTLYKIKPDGSGFVKLIDFNGANGRSPYGSLITDNSFLYGVAFRGGANNLGLVFKVDLLTSAPGLPSDTISNISLFPNPFTQQLKVKFDAVKCSASFITLSDLSGKILHHQKSFSAETILNTEGIAAGFYLLRVEDVADSSGRGGGVWNYKVVKSQ